MKKEITLLGLTAIAVGPTLQAQQDGTAYRKEGAVGKIPGAFDCLNTWTQSGSMRMLRSGDYKLVYDMDGMDTCIILKATLRR